VHVLDSPALIVPLQSADLVVVSVCPDGSVGTVSSTEYLPVPMSTSVPDDEPSNVAGFGLLPVTSIPKSDGSGQVIPAGHSTCFITLSVPVVGGEKLFFLRLFVDQ
jgi:hypothetical protein